MAIIASSRSCADGALRATVVPVIARSIGDQEVADVAVVKHVLLALDADQALLLQGPFALVLDEVVEAVDLGAHELLEEVGVDHGGTHRRRVALVDDPGPDLLLAG